MGKTTEISWTDATWNPHVGCHKVSDGCKFCYMFSDMKRYGQDPNTVRQTLAPTFNAPLKWQEPKKVFTCSWSDFFIEEADAWRMNALDVIRRTPQHTYQILTKRPQRMQRAIDEACRIACEVGNEDLAAWLGAWLEDSPPTNVWLGVTVENQSAAIKRVPYLLEMAAAVHFLSCEPLLGPLDLDMVDAFTRRTTPFTVEWCIAGGESGTNRRELNLEDVISLHAQCKAAGIPFWMKQDSGPKSGRQGRLPDELWNCKEFPKIAVAA